MRKEDLKLLQQYCEQNDLGIIEYPQAIPSKKSGISHAKTKSEGATPMGNNYMKSHFQSNTGTSGVSKPLSLVQYQPHLVHIVKAKLPQPQIPIVMMNQQQMQPNPVLDYQKFLEEEKIYQNQKSKSSMGYYSQGHTPNNNTGRLTSQSKSPEHIGANYYSNPHYSSQKHQQFLVGTGNPSMGMGAPQQIVPQHGHIISQSALSNYSNIQSIMQQQQQHTTRATNQQVNRSASRKKKPLMGGQPSGQGQPPHLHLNYNSSQPNYPTLNYNSSNPQSMQSLFLQQNPSNSTYNQKAQTSLLQKNEEQYSLEGISKDQLNESSHFLYEDPMTRSNQQIQMQTNKNKSLMSSSNNYGVGGVGSGGGGIQQLNDESYFDATLYEQFIAGPHNISQYSTNKASEDMNSYYIQRPLSQNTSLIKNQVMGPSGGGNKFARQSPSQHRAGTTIGQASQQQTGVQPSRKSQRTVNSTMQHSLNSSGQKHGDRRLLMGRTPSPNFLKRIAGIMSNIGSDFLQQHLYKNQMQGGVATSKRSHSKQQFSSNQNQPSGGNFLLASSTPNTLDKSLKQKFVKQQTVGTAAMFLQNQPKFKAGALTTGMNTANNSPKRGVTPIQRNIKHQKTAGVARQYQQQQPLQQNDFQSLGSSDSTPFHGSLQTPQMHQVNPQHKLKIINDIEEQKALALVKGIKEYQSAPVSKQQIVSSAMYQSQQQQLYQQNAQQQFVQPKKMVGEIMEEDPQPLSSHEFLNADDEKSIQSDSHQPLIKNNKPHLAHKLNPHQISQQQQQTSQENQIIDGGTGSNRLTKNQLLMSKNSSDNNSYKHQDKGRLPSAKQQHLYNYGGEQQQQQHQQLVSDQNQIQLYLDQLQSLRQSQNKQAQSQAQSPQTSQDLKNQMKNFPGGPGGSVISSIESHPNKGASTNTLMSAKPQSTQHQRIKTADTNQIAAGRGMLVEEASSGYQRSNYQTNRDTGSEVASSKVVNRKKTPSLDHHQGAPKIAPPSVDMFKDIESKLNEQTNFQKKQQTINFAEDKTPFEKELEQKAQEMKKIKQQQLVQGDHQLRISQQQVQERSGNSGSSNGLTQEQIRLQKYKEDSISILKQLQESGNITESLINCGESSKPQQPKKSTLEIKQTMKYQSQMQYQQQQPPLPQQSRPSDLSKKVEIIDIDIIDKKEQVDMISQSQPQLRVKQNPLLKSPLLQLPPPISKEESKLPSSTKIEAFEDYGDEGGILITQEEERQIKEAFSDINSKAFYGKAMKRIKESDYDEDLKQLSPRSREIISIMRIVSKSFEEKSEPPVTTTDFYRIGKMLGRGAFGKVNLAMHKLVRKLVAIKSLNKECLTDEAQKAKLMKEVSLLLKLRHNHVVKIYETIETEKHIIIVMELCAGGDLLNYVRKRRRLKEPYAKIIFKQIIDGLCYIHSKYIAHRDIKLDNILLDGKGNVKIADFGVSKQCQKGQKMTEQCGTPAYIAPEILKDKGYTFSVDLWSAGVVLFAMLYGTVPFKANNMEELHKLIVKGKYVLKDDISIEARNLLKGLLEVNPEKRLTIKQIYRHKWFSDLDPELQLFNDQERDMIRKEYTYNDPRRYNRNENEEPVDCFTEHNLESVYNSLKNVTSKSIILAPFNSTQSEIEGGDGIDPHMRESIQKLLCEKMMVIKFARRCREIDRQYEFNNNGELDNGVYHKFINNSEEQDSADEDRNQEENKELLDVPMLISTQSKEQKKQRVGGGRASVENSFENDQSTKKLQDKQLLAQKIKESSVIQKEIHRNRKNLENEIDAEMVQTYETFQSRYSSSKPDEEKVTKLISFGYPEQYVTKVLEDNEPNYCTAGYYLLCMDQNYC